MTAFEVGILRTGIFIFGAIIGSFLGASTYRIPRGISLVRPRSQRPACAHPLGTWDLIPIVSFVLHQGKCAYCGARISRRYLLIEAVSGLISLMLFMRHGLGWAFVAYSLLCYLAILLAAIDLEQCRLPNVLTITGIIIGFVINLAWYWAGGATVALTPSPQWQEVWQGAVVNPGSWGSYEFLAPHFTPLHSLLGILVGGGVLWLVAIFSRGGMGGGDVKYLAAIGSFLGPGAALLVLFIASTLGAITGVVLLLTKRISRKEPIPFGPFLSVAVLALALIG